MTLVNETVESVDLPCGSRVTFTCGNTSPAIWQVQKLNGILDDVRTSTALARRKPTRISTTDLTRETQNSRLTISGLTAADNGGIVACLYLDNNGEAIRREAGVTVGRHRLIIV